MQTQAVDQAPQRLGTRVTIQIPHDDQMGVTAEQIANEGQLSLLRPSAQGEMEDTDHQLRSDTEAGEQGTATG